MKIIFSRKGFDSKSGGKPSPILEDGRMWSFPIPARKKSMLREGCQRATYDDIACGEIPMGALVSDLTKGRISGRNEAHLDPDVNALSLSRAPGWRPVFGQSGGAETTLRRNGVGKGDVFLFFGGFRRVTHRGGEHVYLRGAPKQHVLFGWLQIEKRMAVEEAKQELPWAKDHPHLCRETPIANDTIYLSTERLVIDGHDTGLPGGGIFERYDEDLTLTAPGLSMSRWKLPRWFHPKHDGHECLSSHKNPGRWHQEDDHVILDTVPIGQEFVFDTCDYVEAHEWLKNLYETTRQSSPGSEVSAATIRGWPEWSIYVLGPSPESLKSLHLKSLRYDAEYQLLRELAKEFARSRHWKVAQHLSLLHDKRNERTESLYFAQMADRESNGDVRSKIVLAQALENRSLPHAVFPVLDALDKQLDEIDDTELRNAAEMFALETRIRCYSYARQTEDAVKWYGRVPAGQSCEVTTLCQLLACTAKSDRKDVANEIAKTLHPIADALPSAIRAQVLSFAKDEDSDEG